MSEPVMCDGPSLDSAPLALLRDYAALLGAPVTQAEDTTTLDLPESEAGFFRARRLVVALTPESLALHPDAEALVPGSDLLGRLTAAIRARAGRLVHGVLEPTLTPAGSGTPLEVPLRGATSSEARVWLSRLAVGRLLGRVLVRTGATVEECLVRSGIVDLVHGRPVSPGIAARCEDTGGTESTEGTERAAPIQPGSPDSLVRARPDAAVARAALRVGAGECVPYGDTRTSPRGRPAGPPTPPPTPQYPHRHARDGPADVGIRRRRAFVQERIAAPARPWSVTLSLEASMRRYQLAGWVLVAAMVAGCSDTSRVVAPSEASGLDLPQPRPGSGDAATNTRPVSGGSSTAALSIPLPDADYLAATTKIDISGVSDHTLLTSITDGTQTVSFDVTMEKLSTHGTWTYWGLPPSTETSNPHVLFTQQVNTLTMTLAKPATIFGFELGPNLYSSFSFTADFFAGATLVESVTQDVIATTLDPVKLFAVEVDNPITRVVITVVGNPIGFAIAQVRYQSGQGGDAPGEIEDLQEEVAGLGLPAGLANSLDGKLQAALDALAAGDTAAACESLQSLANEVRAQRGKKIPAADADALIAEVEAIMGGLGC